MKKQSLLLSLKRYMSYYGGALLIILTPTALFAASTPDVDADIIVGAQDTKALIFMSYEVPFEDGARSACSGYFVKVSKENEPLELRLGTARHCLNFSSSWDVYPNGPTVKVQDEKKPNAASFSQSFKKKDIIIDGIDHFYSPVEKTNGISYFNLATEIPQIGAKLKLMGYPDGIGPKEFVCVFKGYIKRLKQIKGGVEDGILGYVVCPGATVMPGISGGPVLNERGEVVATLSASNKNETAFVSPNYLVGKHKIGLWKINEEKKIVVDKEETMCFGADHRLLPLDQCP